MRNLALYVLLLAVAACSPTTDITRSSTELSARRTGASILESEAAGNLLRVRVKVNSLAAARTTAEDLVILKRAGFDRVHVEVLGPGSKADAAPAAVLRWSTRNGFEYEERQRH